MPNRPDLIGFGAVAVDDLLYLDTFPKPDSKMQIDKHLRLGGGLAGTALVAAARLGVRPAYFGVLGNNDLSAFTKAEFIRENVQTELIISQEHAKPLHSTILVDRSSGSRTILFTTQGFKLPAANNIRPENFHECHLIFIDTFALPIINRVCDIARSLHIPILADIEDDGILSYQSAFDAIDHLIFNIHLAAQITMEKNPKRILKFLETPQRKATVITAGAKGCWYKEKNRPAYFLQAYPVIAVDTTGCGDVFHGAYAAAIMRGDEISKAVMQASAAAAIKTTMPGGRKGIPNREQLDQFINQHTKIQPQEIS